MKRKAAQRLLYEKGTCKTLMKLTPGVHFAKNLWAAFCQFASTKKNQTYTVSNEKLQIQTLYEKAVCMYNVGEIYT